MEKLLIKQGFKNQNLLKEEKYAIENSVEVVALDQTEKAGLYNIRYLLPTKKGEVALHASMELWLPLSVIMDEKEAQEEANISQRNIAIYTKVKEEYEKTFNEKLPKYIKLKDIEAKASLKGANDFKEQVIKYYGL